MSKIITINDINTTKFYQVPKSFFHNPLYIDMKNESKIAYSILRDLLELSLKNNWVNDNGEVYVKLSRDKMMKYLNIKGTAKYAEVMKELNEKGLIVKKRIGLNKVDETYICIPEEMSVIYNDEELLVADNKEMDTSDEDNSRRFENKTSEGLKIKPPKVSKSNLKRFQKQTHTKTNITKTNITKTNNTTQQELACSEIDTSNKDLIEKETHLTLSPNQIKKVSKWDIKKTDISIKLFKRENGEYFTLLEKIYSDSRNFAPNMAKKGKFHSYEQRTYDFEELESKLLKY